MYKITPTEFGFHLIFSGDIGFEEMTAWANESKEILKNAPDEFLVFVDMRGLIPLGKEAKIVMTEMQSYYRKKGMLRSVVILDSPVTAIQFRRIAGESGIGFYERYIDASTQLNWEQVGMDWIKHAIDPDIVNVTSNK